MKKLLFPVILILLTVLCGCSTAWNKPDEPVTPIELESLSFKHMGSSRDALYTYTIEKTQDGASMHIELFAGEYSLDTVVGQDVLDKLAKVVEKHRIYRWNGFDKAKSFVSDGEGFTLDVCLADGTQIYAHGAGAFPEGYRNAKEDICSIFEELLRQYGDVPENLQ